MNFGGSITRSRAKAQMEETSESKAEEFGPQEKKERNPTIPLEKWKQAGKKRLGRNPV